VTSRALLVVATLAACRTQPLPIEMDGGADASVSDGGRDMRDMIGMTDFPMPDLSVCEFTATAPPGPSVACGMTALCGGAQACCVGGSIETCMNACNAGQTTFRCAEAADCPGAICCFSGASGSACVANCTAQRLCSRSSDCPMGQSCRKPSGIRVPTHTGICGPPC
jgi:hypothetical protein